MYVHLNLQYHNIMVRVFMFKTQCFKKKVGGGVILRIPCSVDTAKYPEFSEKLIKLQYILALCGKPTNVKIVLLNNDEVQKGWS